MGVAFVDIEKGEPEDGDDTIIISYQEDYYYTSPQIEIILEPEPEIKPKSKPISDEDIDKLV